MELITSQVSFYGRLADELTREVVSHRKVGALLKGSAQQPIVKSDGYFVFADVEPSATEYEIVLDAKGYQTRTVKSDLPVDTAVELSYPGEDELFLVVNTVQSNPNRITFTAQPFITTIAADSRVIGPSNVDTTLAEPLEGDQMGIATLTDVTGITPGAILRVLRSPNIVLRPGPYYLYPPGTTQAAFKVVDNSSAANPIADVRIDLVEVNDIAIDSTQIGAVDIKSVVLPPLPPPLPPRFILGTERDTTTYTNNKGAAVFYYPPGAQVTRLLVNLSKDGYVSDQGTINLAGATRTFMEIILQRI